MHQEPDISLSWDVRACLVDEDYTGFVHLSLSYTKIDVNNDGDIYVGDKLSQMMVLTVDQNEVEGVAVEASYSSSRCYL